MDENSLRTHSAQTNVFQEDCSRIIHLLKHCRICVPEENRFFINVDCDRESAEAISRRNALLPSDLFTPQLIAGQKSLAYTGFKDFGHTCAGWEQILTLGIFGICQRLQAYAAAATPEKRPFYDGLLQVWQSVLDFLSRAADAAEGRGRLEMAESLRRLTHRAPETMYEAMQTILVYYRLQMSFDGTTLRTLGRLDQLLYPFYIKDEASAPGLIADFLQEVDSLKFSANIPFALGGTDQHGNCLVNALTYRLLEGYQAGNTAFIKLHLLCSKNMPPELTDLVLRMVREGKNSIVFMNDAQVIAALENLGADRVHAANYHVVGCYECGADEEITCSCNARVNLPKALELALNNGKDMLTGEQIGLPTSRALDSFDALFQEFQRQCVHLCRCAMDITDRWERYYPILHAAPILSATYLSALESGRDVYDRGARYCNSSLNALGLATTVDSLAAIRKLVFEDKTFTLSQLVSLLQNNWQDCEPLRLRVRNTFPKYGLADPATDALAAQTVSLLAKTVNGQPNAKGGVYRLGLFSIDWRWSFGEKTAASADGRLAGEPISQNTGASFGADREGATAHLLSVAGLDTLSTPNGSIVDIDLHTSAVRGESGLRAMTAALKTYFRLGGFAVQFNVLNADILRKASADPDAYPNLQVRLCGWNVLFSSLSPAEQNEFITRWERFAG